MIDLVDKLKFIIENLYISTKAISVGIINASGQIAAECGKSDLSLFSSHSNIINKEAVNLLNSFTGTDNEYNLFLNGKNGKVYCSSLIDDMFLLMLFPRDVDIIDLKSELENASNDVKKVLSDFKPYLTKEVTGCRL